MRIEIVVEQTDDGRFRATWEAMHRCVAFGGTFEQARQAMTEHILSCLANMNEPCPGNLVIVATQPAVACLEGNVPQEDGGTTDRIEEPQVEARNPMCEFPHNIRQAQSNSRFRQTTVVEATIGSHNDAAVA